jgi:hypothetical protein
MSEADQANVNAAAKRKNGEEACKTFVEQTKQLITLASAFIFAPAAVQIILQLSIGKRLIIAEIFFIASVLAGYVALGSIAGSQHKGEFNVHNRNAKWSGLLQFFAYLAGLVLFILWFTSQPLKPQTSPQPTVTISTQSNTPEPEAQPAPPTTGQPNPCPGHRRIRHCVRKRDERRKF